MKTALQPLASVLGSRDEQPAVELWLPATRSSLGLIRETLRTFLRQQVGLSDTELEIILLAVQEASTNVVRHAYAQCDDVGRIQVRAELDPYLLRVAVADEGPGYDFEGADSPDFDHPREGGFGLHLMRQTMSKVSYLTSGRQNVLLMEKTIHVAEDSP